MKAYKIALGGIISALCLLTMFMTGIFPVLSILLPMISGIFMMIMVSEININWAFLTYISVSLLSLMLTSDKESVLIFITFFGHYPITRFLINRINSKALKAVLKFSLFNICIIIFFLFTTYVLKLTAFLEEINEFGTYGIPAILVGFSQSPVTGLLVLIFIIVAQALESNFLHPIVIGKKLDLHPVTIVISLLIFGHFFGIMGMIIATPVVAMLKSLYIFFDEKYEFFGYAKEENVKKEISKIRYSK